MNKPTAYLDQDSRILNPFDRTSTPRVGDKGIAAPGQVKRIDVDRRAVDAIMSTGTVDRHGEVIDPRAFEAMLPRFNENPVLLADHDHTRQIGHWENVRVTSRGLEGTAIFAETPDAENQFALYRDGHRKAFSVGFIAHEWEFDQREVDGVTTKLRRFTRVELLECSAVAIPANPDALAASLNLGGKRGGGGAGGGQRVNKGEQLGQRIRERREELELSLQDVAADLPITASTLGQIERGSIIRPPDEVIQSLAEVLDLDLEELQRLADADAESAGVGGGDEGHASAGAGAGAGAGRISNRKLRSMIHRELKPVVRQVIREVLREEAGEAIGDAGLREIAEAFSESDRRPATRSAAAAPQRAQAQAPAPADAEDQIDPKAFWDSVFDLQDAVDDQAALKELADAFTGD